MAANDKYQLICVANLQKVAIANTFYINVLNDDSAGNTANSINTMFNSYILDSIQAVQSSAVEYECNLIRKVDPTSEPAEMFPLSLYGDLGPAVLPSNLTCCVNTWSNDGRPPFRGRWFISGLLETDIEDGRWTTATETRFDALLSVIKDSWGPSGQTYQLNHWSEAQEQFDPIVRGRIAAIPRKLRNRTPGLCSIS